VKLRPADCPCYGVFVRCAGQQLKATRRVLLVETSRDLLRWQGRRAFRAFQNHCLVVFDVAGTFSLLSARGHVGRHGPAGARKRLAARKRSRSASGKSAGADASASTTAAAFALCAGADASASRVAAFALYAGAVGPGTIDPGTIDACTERLTATQRWRNGITSNQRARSSKTCTATGAARSRAPSRSASDNRTAHRAASLAG
jgi:hypothetical protein